jgi:dimethylhistidine N-methyltransferase
MKPRPTTAAAPVRLLDLHPTHGDFRSDVLEGLSADEKHLSPKYFYDELGSKLFDRITDLPEYYLTRTELAIMDASMGEIAASVGPRARVIEFGSGSGLKTRKLLAGLIEPDAYVPVEISRSHLLGAAQAIADDFPGIEVLPVCADFTRPFELPTPTLPAERNLVYFPGSTIGNFPVREAAALLEVMRTEAGSGGALLIGVDLRKDRGILEAAYNDAAGVTAEFNLNLLRRINTEIGADFDLERFEHRAVWNDDAGRIEMHLHSTIDQAVSVEGESFSFVAGESIVTEYSHKYDLDEFAKLAGNAGFSVAKVPGSTES